MAETMARFTFLTTLKCQLADGSTHILSNYKVVIADVGSPDEARAACARSPPKWFMTQETN